MKKIIINVVLSCLIIYLLVSSIYIFGHVDFNSKPEVVGMGFSSSNNLLRVFMGLPPTYTTYGGVSPIYLIQALVRLIILIILILLIKKINKKQKNG